MENEILEILKRMEGRFDKFEGRFDKFEGRFDCLESKVDENTQILRALEHAAEVNKAEHDKMANDIAHIKGEVEAIKKDVSTVEIVTANNYADLAKLKAVK